MDSLKPLHKQDLLVTDLDDELLVYDATTKQVHVLNATAKLIWSLCDGDHTTKEIAETIRQEFAVAAGIDLHEDVRRMLEGFRENGLV